MPWQLAVCVDVCAHVCEMTCAYVRTHCMGTHTHTHTTYTVRKATGVGKVTQGEWEGESQVAACTPVFTGWADGEPGRDRRTGPCGQADVREGSVPRKRWSFSDSVSLLRVPENCATQSAPSTTGEGHRSCRGDRALPVSVKSFHYPHKAHSASLLAKLEATGVNRVLLRKEVRFAFVVPQDRCGRRRAVRPLGGWRVSHSNL